MGTVYAERAGAYQPLPVEDPPPDEAVCAPLTAPQAASSSSPSPPPRARASWAYIYALCIANFGISGAWALEFATVTPFFEAALHAGHFLSHIVWIVGPLSGLLVAPVVGALSDRCTSSFGRRRPFIVAGMLATVLSMLIFSNSLQLGALLSGAGSDARAAKTASVVVALLSFCVLDLAINTTMWPVRALQADLLPQYEQHRVQSASVVIGSLGDLGANALLRLWKEPVSHMRSCYLLAAVLYSCTVTVLLVLGRETPLQTDARDDDHHHDHDHQLQQQQPRAMMGIFGYLKSLPAWMWRIGGTYALGFFMLFCVMPNLSSWLGDSVLGGDPTAPKQSAAYATYERGVKMYADASLLRALVQIVFSAVYPFLLRFIRAGALMGLCFGLFGVLMALFSTTKSALVGQLMVVMLAFPEAAHFTLPTGLTVEFSDESNRGKYLGALNCFAVIPQLIDTTYTGYVSDHFGEAAVMIIGAVWGMLTGVSGFVFMNVQHASAHQIS